MELALTQAPVLRFLIRCDPGNHASAGVARRLGFRYVGRVAEPDGWAGDRYVREVPHPTPTVDTRTCGNTHRGYAVAMAVNGYTGSQEDYLKRLRRIEGQVRGIARMVEDDTYCIDVLTQVSAATKALQAVSLGLLEDHISHCVVDAAKESEEAKDEKVREASAAIARLVRS